jgi:hypothetical protein
MPSVLDAPRSTQLHAWLTPFRYSVISTGPLLPAPVPCTVMARCAQDPADRPTPVHWRMLCAPTALLVAAVSVTLLRLPPSTMDTHGVLWLMTAAPPPVMVLLPKLNTVAFCCPAATTGLSHAVSVIPAPVRRAARSKRRSKRRAQSGPGAAPCADRAAPARRPCTPDRAAPPAARACVACPEVPHPAAHALPTLRKAA